MVLKKTLESPLDSKEIKPVNHKGNQSWIFIGRTDAEAEAEAPPDVKSRLTGKDPDAGKDWSQEQKRVAENEMVREHHQLNGHESEQTQGDSEGQRSLVLPSLGSQRTGHNRGVAKDRTQLGNWMTTSTGGTYLIHTACGQHYYYPHWFF